MTPNPETVCLPLPPLPHLVKSGIVEVSVSGVISSTRRVRQRVGEESPGFDCLSVSNKMN